MCMLPPPHEDLVSILRVYHTPVSIPILPVKKAVLTRCNPIMCMHDNMIRSAIKNVDGIAERAV